jgi:hypothetical protein
MNKFILETLSLIALVLLAPLVAVYMIYVRVTSKMDYEPVHWKYLPSNEPEPSFYTLISESQKKP